MNRRVIPRRVALLLPMLGATIDAEALAARNALVRALATVGLDLNDLAASLATEPEPPAMVPQPTAAPLRFSIWHAPAATSTAGVSPCRRSASSAT